VRFRHEFVVIAVLILVGPARALAEEPRSASTVGMPAKIEQLVLPGTELEAKPIVGHGAPLVLRVVESYPHGSAFRYDIVYYALEPGEYDLKKYLRRKDGSSTDDLPSCLVKVEPILPPGQVEPHRLSLRRSPFLGGYRLLIGVGGTIWLAGLAAILIAGRRRRRLDLATSARTVTLADRLKPLVDLALAGRLSTSQHAELERLLIGYWRKRLGLEHVAPAQFMAVLRNHEEAGELVRKLEDWLHRPAGAAEPVDVSTLLKPYQAISADSLADGVGLAPGEAAAPLRLEDR
jgi:hypothetical protein